MHSLVHLQWAVWFSTYKYIIKFKIKQFEFNIFDYLHQKIRLIVSRSNNLHSRAGGCSIHSFTLPSFGISQEVCNQLRNPNSRFINVGLYERSPRIRQIPFLNYFFILWNKKLYVTKSRFKFFWKFIQKLIVINFHEFFFTVFLHYLKNKI